MTQNILHKYHGLDTSRLHNRRFVETVHAGVYSGFKLRVNAGYPDRLDIVRGNAVRSVLVQSEGVIIEETTDLVNAVKIQPADSVRTRIDLVVCEYMYTPDTSVPATYKVIRGQNQESLSDDPVIPGVQNDYQVVLGWVYVKPQQASGGQAQVRVDPDDVIQAPEADFVEPQDMAALKPEVDFANTKRIFVYPGVFPNADKSSIIRWLGGYSEEIDDSTMDEGETRYFLFGITDDREVSVVSYSSDPDTLGGYGADTLPLCIATATKVSGSAKISTLEDVRFPFARQLTPQFERTSYTMELVTSVFQNLRVDVLENDEFIDLDTVDGPTGYETLLRAYIDRADTSLTFEWTGTTNPDADVTIVTENLLEDTPISTVTHFMMIVDTDIPNLSFEYSTVSKYSGFTNQAFTPNAIITIPAGGGNRLYIRFTVPKDAFVINDTQKIFSYGAYINLDPETLNQRVIAELGVTNLLHSIPNLISNGNFRWWSRNDENDIEPDSDSPSTIQYAVSVDEADIDAGNDVFAADGWQFTKIQYEGASRNVRRVIYSGDALSAGITDAVDTCLYWEGAGGDQGLVNYLEYRVPVVAEMQGQKITFAIDYKASSREAIGVAIGFYSRDETGEFTLLQRDEKGATTAEGTLLIESSIAIAENVYAVGLIVILRQTTGDSEVFVRNARAATGSFTRLPYTYDPNARTKLLPYYERGRVIAAARVLEGDDVSAGAQFGAVKHIGLSKDGALIAREVSGTEANRSQNVDQITLTATAQGLVVNGRAISSGFVKLDLEWEVFPLFPIIE
jgi:hypothetical protein